jgi:hypothetical protein
MADVTTKLEINQSSLERHRRIVREEHLRLCEQAKGQFYQWLLMNLDATPLVVAHAAFEFFKDVSP